jgi:hypothetical protein
MECRGGFALAAPAARGDGPYWFNFLIVAAPRVDDYPEATSVRDDPGPGHWFSTKTIGAV